jgi:hypothetical protein
VTIGGGGGFFLGRDQASAAQPFTFSGGNTNGVDGGAINNSGTATVIGSTFSGYTLSNAPQGGGAIFNSGTLTIADSTFSGNKVIGTLVGTALLGTGGAIMMSPSNPNETLTITNSMFIENEAGANGGAISSNSGNAAIRSSTFIGNEADLNAGAVVNKS